MNGYEWVTVKHPDWKVSDHPEIRHVVVAERRRGNSIRYLAAGNANMLAAKIKKVEEAEGVAAEPCGGAS
jgi:hypothetical protein